MDSILNVAPADDFNPWATIWTRPRETIRRATQKGSMKPIFILAAAMALSHLLNQVMANWPAEYRIAPLLFLHLPLTTGGALIGLLVWSFVLAFLGRLLGGKAQTEEIIQAVGWSGAPLILLAIVQIFALAAFEAGAAGLALVGVGLLLILASLAFGIWSLVILAIGLSELQAFTLLKASLLTIAYFAITMIAALVVAAVGGAAAGI